MTATIRVHGDRRRPRGITTAGAAAMCAVAALLAGCSGGSLGSGASGTTLAGVNDATGRAPIPQKEASGTGKSASQIARLIPAQSIIYTASLTVQARDVPAATQRAASIVAAAGGYLASEYESARPGQRQAASASLELKIPVAAYPATLARLRTELGTQTALSQQAQDVTQQVADVTSRVASAQAAIAQLRALLTRAGSVSSLLLVQDQINSQESALESLQAQQRALAHQTTFATVSLRLVAHRGITVKHKKEHGFGAGLGAGWRGLRRATAWLLTAVGTVLPFAIIIALAGGIGYAGRRWLLRRRSGPTPAG